MKNYFATIAFFLFSLAVPSQSQSARDSSYTLRPNDSIQLEVYEEPDLSVAVNILKTGEASFPLIGSVKIGNLTINAATEKIRGLYAKDYLVDPKIRLTVSNYAVDHVTVIGAVSSPGQVEIPASGILDLASAVAAAGGLAPNADASSIQLIKASGGTTSFSRDSLQAATGRQRLSPGDRIVVNESRFHGKTITFLGQIGRRGPLAFPVNGHLDLVTAVGMAGGLTELANPTKISINRKGKVIIADFRKLSKDGDKPFLLEPGDIITVPERWF